MDAQNAANVANVAKISKVATPPPAAKCVVHIRDLKTLNSAPLASNAAAEDIWLQLCVSTFTGA